MSAQPSPTPDDDMFIPEDVPESTAKPRTVCFRLLREGVSQFAIEYKDKDDLYQSFMRKLDELNIPRRKMYFVGDYEDHYEINDADTLLGLTLDNHCVKINVCLEDDFTDSSSDDPELPQESVETKREAKGQKCPVSKNCRRGHSHGLHRPGEGHSRSRDYFACSRCSCGSQWKPPAFCQEPWWPHSHAHYRPPPHDHHPHEPWPHAHSHCGPLPRSHYGHPHEPWPHSYFHYGPPPHSHNETDPRLQHCPFFGMM
ncbi:hypothetical protein KIN20_014016 [Parelaphostrongylus tenuis]|uniref:Uncharacterized protein n=1 Tax=Parelaphostrongylus tenuis TaxID=148309 RepID=A0AAD5QRJ1_PARTN|nr:hypothetical protein KIN20_014016 [Parelaphostrongylus tenuis]